MEKYELLPHGVGPGPPLFSTMGRRGAVEGGRVFILSFPPPSMLQNILVPGYYELGFSVVGPTTQGKPNCEEIMVSG